MARLGAFCFSGTGHIHPMTALARKLEERGHKILFFGIADTEARVRAAGIDFHLIGEQDYPPGTLHRLDQRLGRLKGLAALRFTAERVKNTARMVLRDGPDAVRAERLDGLLVDEAEAGGSIAEHLGLPFVSIAFFPPLLRSDRIPPWFFAWGGGQSWPARMRNRIGHRIFLSLLAIILPVINERRKMWGLKPLKNALDALSPLAQITQLPACLEFAPCEQPELLHYTGPFLDGRLRPPVDFPWGRLNGRPLVYASMGTLQNGSEAIFRMIAEACDGLGVQLVLSLGGGLQPESLADLPGDPLVVAYAPQLELIQRAALVITHAGLNTVLESLAAGVPMVALPQANDQPGVAARVAASGAGVMITPRRLNPPRLRQAVRLVLNEKRFQTAAQGLQRSISATDGLEKAADIVENAMGLKP